MSRFEELYHKVLTDAQFRKELVENPHRTLESLGITPTPEILAAIKQIEHAVGQLEGDLGGPIDKVQVT